MTLRETRCIGEPVSWLRLERFHLGELAEAERAVVAEHVAACAACAACAARVEADEALELPPLQVKMVAAIRPRSSRALRLIASAGALAAAAVVLLVLGRTPRAPPSTVDRGERARPKGDGIAFVLVRDDGQRMVDAQGVFRSGDRFKALVTCAPSLSASFDLVVLDSGGASFPLAPAAGLACGNEVPLPGAFRLTATGGSETVCLVWGDAADLDREALSRTGIAGHHALCKDLHPAD
jgi:hypothetical protein